MTRTLVLTVDRDNDLGIKTAIRGPVVGRRQVLTAALKLGIADPRGERYQCYTWRFITARQSK